MKRRVGDIVSINLGDGRYAFGIVLEEPLVGYFDLISTDPSPPVVRIMEHPVIFRLWTMNRAVKKEWPLIGHTEVTDSLKQQPWFFKEDPITHRLSKTQDGVAEVPISPEEARTLERAAVWDAVHVVDRLRSHFAGVEDTWTRSMKLDPPK